MIKLAGSNNGSAEYFYCIQGAARILTRQRKFDEALDVLSLTPAERLSGTWRPSMQLSRAEVLTAASRLEPALKAIQAVIDDPDATKSHRSRAADLKIEVTK
jgi:outer membrane PBP1 activator LpoA protein